MQKGGPKLQLSPNFYIFVESNIKTYKRKINKTIRDEKSNNTPNYGICHGATYGGGGSTATHHP